MVYRVAVLDLGTNTFHLLIAEWENQNESNILVRTMKPVLLGGEAGIENKRIQYQAVQRALGVLKEYKTKINEYNVERVYAVGTAAIRSADNSDEFLSQIKKELGWQVQLITGKEEAAFIYHGAKQGADFNSGSVLFMDLGGGSVEFMIGNSKELFWYDSYPVGAAMLKAQFHHSDPMNHKENQAMVSYLADQLAPVLAQCKRYHIQQLVGVSGSFETLYDLVAGKLTFEEKKSLRKEVLERNELVQLYQALLDSTQEERLAMPGMIEFRASMMTVAAQLVHFIVEQATIQQIQVVNYALKEGILWCARYHPEKLKVAT